MRQVPFRVHLEVQVEAVVETIAIRILKGRYLLEEYLNKFQMLILIDQRSRKKKHIQSKSSEFRKSIKVISVKNSK